jgi:hypothetical protein
MGSVWLSKKAFLYFGGAAIILIGGMIVAFSPYHYFNYALSENQLRTWSMKGDTGYYPEVEVSLSLRPSNVTYVSLDLVFLNNDTLELTIVNITLGPEHQLEGPSDVIYEYSQDIDLAFGNYTVGFEKIDGAGLVDLGLQQLSDSRTWIVIGGSMNILGVIMGILGYLVPGSFLPSDSDTIVEWGYEEEDATQ